MRGSSGARMPTERENGSDGRPPPSVHSLDSLGIKQRDYECPICLELLSDAYITHCGHSFCYTCITVHLQTRSRCPTCSQALLVEQIHPNFLLSAIIGRLKESALAGAWTSDSRPRTSTEIVKIVTQKNWNVEEIQTLLDALQSKKHQLEVDEREVEAEILLEFLLKTREKKTALLHGLEEDIKCLQDDIDIVSSRTAAEEAHAGTKRSRDDALGTAEAAGSGETAVAAVGGGGGNDRTLMAKKERVADHLDDLEACYFGYARGCRGGGGTPLEGFTKTLSRFTRHSRFEVVATLKHADLFNNPSIVSSIVFDGEGEYFATAGVTKKIKVFEYASLLNDDTDAHYPIREMACRSKISCLSWNSYLNSHIASSDYEGIVNIWDAFDGTRIMNLEEHTKRVWSVDFSQANPTILASGSDDAKMKIWNTNLRRSVATVDSKANICCVQFNPFVGEYIAFGSADHKIHYYDIRKLSAPVVVLEGHRKAVSYVKFVSRNEIASASIDSTLRLWDLSDGAEERCKRTFTGHTNEKNFVGLSCHGDYIACGSENNSVYTYYKELSKPAIRYEFAKENTDGEGQFISSVCWRRGSNMLLAANSQGTIKVLQLK